MLALVAVDDCYWLSARFGVLSNQLINDVDCVSNGWSLEDGRDYLIPSTSTSSASADFDSSQLQQLEKYVVHLEKSTIAAPTPDIM